MKNHQKTKGMLTTNSAQVHANESPPNLDELFQKVYKQILNKKNHKNTGSSLNGHQNNKILIGFILGLIFVIWLLSGIFIVSPAEQGVVLRFGRYTKTVGPGPHWIPRFISQSYILDVQRISSFSYNAEMLTKDENIVFVSLSVQFRVKNPRLYLFHVVNPVESLQQATASALRQVVGNTVLDDILTTGRAEAREKVKEQIIQTLTPYQTGIEITDVNLQPARPPEEVTEAFDDAIKAREDEQRYINQAEAYREKVVPIAEGQAKRKLQQAQAFKQQAVLKARSEVAPYLALLSQYQHHPKAMKNHLYFKALQPVFEKTRKILLSSNKNQMPFIYLPIDKLMKTHNPEKLSEAKEIKSPSPNDELISQNKTQNKSSNLLSKSRLSREDYVKNFRRYGYEK